MNKLVHINFLKLVSAVTFFLLSTSLNAATFTEDFSDPFPTWESGWLGSSSNIENNFGIGSTRGDAWNLLYFTDDDTDENNETINIAFKSEFGKSITSFDMWIDVASVPTSIKVYDGSGGIIFDDALNTDGLFERILLPSTNGISGFSLLGDSSILGNASIDKIEVSTIPVPAAAWLFGSGLIGLIGVARRKPQA